jgi:flagellar basal-body rod protein FlgF/flagellar basal-body rod protein FlgG
MNSGYYAACAGLVARTEALDIAANNLANINTTAFRGQDGLFRSLVADSQGLPTSSLNEAINDYGVVGGTYINVTAGHLERTDNSLDFGLEGQGFFAVQTPAGVRYTRNGSFQVDKNGTLLTADSNPVLGQQGPIRLPSGPVSVSDDGTISVAGAVVAKLQLADIDPQALTAEGNTYFQAPASAVTPATTTQVRQGMLEGSNVEPVSAMVGLIEVQRHADLLQRTLRIFSSDFDSTAVQALPRVS